MTENTDSYDSDRSGGSSMRWSRFVIGAAAVLAGCVSEERDLSPNHGVRIEKADLTHAETSHDRSGPILIEVIVDAEDSTLAKELAESTNAAFQPFTAIKAVDCNSDLVLRLIVHADKEPGFEGQQPLRLQFLLVPTEDDNPSDPTHLLSLSLMEGHFRCLRKQAAELSGRFVAQVGAAMRMAREMKVDAH